MSMTRAAIIQNLEKEIKDLKERQEFLLTIIAENCPEKLNETAAITPFKKVDQKLFDQILLWGREGKMETQWIEQLRLTPGEWRDLKAQNPKLERAAHVALTACKAAWNEYGRRAMEEGNQKYPISLYKTMEAEVNASLGLTGDEQGGSGKGDASKLVILDLRREVTPAA